MCHICWRLNNICESETTKLIAKIAIMKTRLVLLECRVKLVDVFFVSATVGEQKNCSTINITNQAVPMCFQKLAPLIIIN